MISNKKHYNQKQFLMCIFSSSCIMQRLTIGLLVAKSVYGNFKAFTACTYINVHLFLVKCIFSCFKPSCHFGMLLFFLKSDKVAR